MAVHPTALVSPEAQVSSSASVGPYCVVGAATIGAGTVLHPHVVVADGVELGADVEIFPGAVLGREPKGAGATARVPTFERRVVVAEGCSVGPHAIIYYDVRIGPGTLIGDGASIREGGRIGARCIISRYVTLNYAVTVGDGVKVMDMTHLTGGLVVADDAFVSAGVITTNDNVIRQGFGSHIQAPKVGPGAVVGGGAVLLPAVEIGMEATVAAGAVVTRTVAPQGRVAGVPAKPFGTNPTS